MYPAQQCVKLLDEDEDALIKSATTYVVKGDLTDEQLEAVKEYCINPVDSREASAEKPETLVMDFEEPADVKILDGFKDMEEDKFKELYDSLNLAMTFKDFLHIQNYYKGEENRDPSMTEIRVLDTSTGLIIVVIQHSLRNLQILDSRMDFTVHH